MNLRKALQSLVIGPLIGTVVAATGASAVTVAMAEDTRSARSRHAAVDIPAGCTRNAHDVVSCLNNPDASDPAKRAVLIDRLVELVNDAGDGDRIRIAMYVWRDDGAGVTEFTDELIAAEARGANVRILLDLQSKQNNGDTFDRLKAAFGERLQLCDAGASTPAGRCLTEGGIQHNKLFLFDIADRRTAVVSSINLTSAISSRYNNMVLLDHDEKLYNFYLDYFQRMRDGSWSGWDTPGERVASGSDGRTRGNVYPQLDSHDTVANILDAITDCRSGAKRVSLLANKFGMGRIEPGTPLREALKGLPGTCDVRVLASGPAPGVIQELRDLGVRARRYDDEPHHHSKYVLVDAQIQDLIGDGPRAEREYVWTGSLNMTSGYKTSANSNVMVRGHGAHAVYQRQFAWLWGTTNP